MALENLDTVEWDKLEHADGNASDMPKLLLELEAVANDDDFLSSFFNIWSKISYSSPMYSATAPTIRFLIRMISNIDNSFQKIMHCVLFGDFISQLDRMSDIYHTISNGKDTFIQLLSDDDSDVQTAGIYILSLLVEQHELITPAILKCIAETSHAWTRAAAIWVFAHFAHYSQASKTEPYLVQLLTWIENTDSLPVRYGAALGYVLLNTQSQIERVPTPEIVIESITQGFVINVLEIVQGDETDKMDFIYGGFFPYGERSLQLINQHLRYENKPEKWIESVHKTGLSPFKAHFILREILDFSVNPLKPKGIRKKWDKLTNLRPYHKPEEILYSANSLPRTASFSILEKRVLAALVNCDSFWAIPNNLLSACYGLPDDREALRRLLLRP